MQRQCGGRPFQTSEADVGLRHAEDAETIQVPERARKRVARQPHLKVNRESAARRLHLEALFLTDDVWDLIDELGAGS